MNRNRSYLILLMWLGIIEGFSTLILFFIAMPMKYFYDQPIAVTIAGPIHGFLFLALVSMFLIGKSQVPLSTKMVVGGIVGAVLPFGPFVVDVKLYKLLQSKK